MGMLTARRLAQGRLSSLSPVTALCLPTQRRSLQPNRLSHAFSRRCPELPQEQTHSSLHLRSIDCMPINISQCGEKREWSLPWMDSQPPQGEAARRGERSPMCCRGRRAGARGEVGPPGDTLWSEVRPGKGSWKRGSGPESGQKMGRVFTMRMQEDRGVERKDTSRPGWLAAWGVGAAAALTTCSGDAAGWGRGGRWGAAPRKPPVPHDRIWARTGKEVSPRHVK